MIEHIEDGKSLAFNIVKQDNEASYADVFQQDIYKRKGIFKVFVTTTFSI